jgi:hypothetical protein
MLRSTFEFRPVRRPRILALLAALVVAAACGGLRESVHRSRAADVPDTDVRRLPPSRKAEVPDVMLAQADRGRVLGTDSARVALFVISDYQCEECRVWFEQTLPAVRAAYTDSGRVRLTWVHYPLREHPSAVRAASAALCAGVQGKFFEASARLFAAQALWRSAPDAVAVIDSLGHVPGLDAFSYRDCVQSGRLLRKVRADIDWVDTARASQPLTVIVGAHRLSGSPSLAALRAAIDSAALGR